MDVRVLNNEPCCDIVNFGLEGELAGVTRNFKLLELNNEPCCDIVKFGLEGELAGVMRNFKLLELALARMEQEAGIQPHRCDCVEQQQRRTPDSFTEPARHHHTRPLQQPQQKTQSSSLRQRCEIAKCGLTKGEFERLKRAQYWIAFRLARLRWRLNGSTRVPLDRSDGMLQDLPAQLTPSSPRAESTASSASE